MKILLYGGTFDPPHQGHQNLLKAAVQTIQPDKIIVMPAGTPPHKKASTTPACLRLAMCRCFETVSEKVQLSDWELSQHKKSYTIDTVQMLKQRFSDGEIYLCVGGDMLESFESWKDWQTILKECVLVAHCRQPQQTERFEQAAQQLQSKGAKVILLQAQVILQASSEIRNLLQSGQADSAVLPQKAAEIVRRYGLYQQKEGADNE